MTNKDLARSILGYYTKFICKREYQKQKFKRFNERAVEFAFVFNVISKIYPKSILDVGTGTTALPHLMRNCGPLVTASDNIRDYWAKGILNRHYHIIDDDITKTQLKGKFDLITCISVLEHIEKYNDAVGNM